MSKDQAAAEQSDKQTTRIDTTSEQFLDQWNRLISTTNWDKGRIIADWRQAQVNDGSAPRDYSDEAWSRHIGNVSPQHVGRLRRAYERFGGIREDYPGLFWSHFQVALDWPDSEMWLEGAVQNTWSISQMRRKRWETLGSLPENEPSGDDIVAAEYDEDVDHTADGTADEPLSEKIDTVHDPDEEQSAASFHSETGASNSDDETELSGEVGQTHDTEAAAEESPAGIAVRPFEDLPPLPDDLAEAFETFKLGILRHKMDGWVQVPCEDVVRALQALEQLAVAEADD